ncbi:hypothetical protein Tco_0623936 [Tanacetum coccineum]|uniref:DUF4283 domain-containing protein n=1 Tax=Tanacetum coccineum TaxID=301880 RepID=A0ABQ4WCF5_9ASTR
MERGFLTAKGRESGNSVKEKRPSMDDGPNVGNGGEASGSVTCNIDDSPSPAGNVPYLISFATKVKGNTSQKTVNFRPLFTPVGNGKRVSYLIVKNYMKNTWGKFGLVKSMIIKDMHFFKFGSKEGMASYAKVDVHLRDTIVFHLPNSVEEGWGNKNPSTNPTYVVAKINELERQMPDGKLVFVDEHGKSLEMKVTNEASASKTSTSIRDQLVESDEDKVELPNLGHLNLYGGCD